MDVFGSSDPKKMPSHLFFGAVHLDYPSAKRGNPKKQNFSVCPRHWYMDADFICERCKQEFTWTASEQKKWFEDYFFWIDSRPRLCKKCMAGKKHLEKLRKEYDDTLAQARDHGTREAKLRIISIVSELEASFGYVPEKMIETKLLFERQISKT